MKKCMAMFKVLVLDLDMTLWNHPDISALTLPFKLEDRDVIVDSRGVRVMLYPGVRELLRWARTSGKVISIASWNNPEPALEALRLFGILDYFFKPKIQYHPHKHLMLLELIRDLEELGYRVHPEDIVYVDDRDIHLGEIYSRVGRVRYVQMWRDARDHWELIKLLQRMESEKFGGD